MATATNQATHIEFRFLKDTGLIGGATNERDNAFGTSGKLYSIFVDNTAAGAKGYLKLYDTASAVTVGTTVPDLCIRIEHNERHMFQFPEGITFQNGMGYTVDLSPGTATSGAISAAANPTVFTFK